MYKNPDDEIWIKIEGFNNYSVSNTLNIRNDKTGKLLKKPNSNCVFIVKNGKNICLDIFDIYFKIFERKFEI
jgi:hypothetical protein